MGKTSLASANGKVKSVKKGSLSFTRKKPGRIIGGTTPGASKPCKINCTEVGGAVAGVVIFEVMKPKKPEHAFTRPQEEAIDRQPQFAMDCKINDVTSLRQSAEENVPVPQENNNNFDVKVFVHIIEDEANLNNREYRKDIGTNIAFQFTEFAKSGNFEYENCYRFNRDETAAEPVPICHKFLDEDIKGIVNAIWMDVDYEDLLDNETTKKAIFGDRTDGGLILGVSHH